MLSIKEECVKKKDIEVGVIALGKRGRNLFYFCN